MSATPVNHLSPLINEISSNIMALPSGNFLALQSSNYKINSIFRSSPSFILCHNCTQWVKIRNVTRKFMDAIFGAFTVENKVKIFAVFQNNCMIIFDFNELSRCITFESKMDTPFIFGAVHKIHYIDGKFHFFYYDQHIIYDYRPNNGIEANNNDYRLTVVSNISANFLRFYYDSCYSRKAQSIYVFGGNESVYGPPTDYIHQYCDGQWNKLMSKLPIPLKAPYSLCTSSGDFCLIFGGLMHTSPRQVNTNIYCFDTMTQKCKKSIRGLPLMDYEIKGVIVSNQVKNELAVFGYTRSYLSPDYLIQFMAQWFCIEHFHVIIGQDLPRHLVFNMDDVLQ